MTEPLHASTFRVSHSSEEELDRKLIHIMQRRGYVVTKAGAERITVGELARRVNRNLSNVSMRIRGKHCPPFVFGVGNKKILWLEVNPGLISYLTNATPGQRTDLKA